MSQSELPHGLLVQDLPQEVLLPMALGYHSVVATQVGLSVMLAWLTASPIVTLVLWLLLAKPLGFAVGTCVTKHWRGVSVLFMAAAIEGFLRDWRIGVAVLMVCTALLVLATGTVAEWRGVMAASEKAR
jgi:hypothetical protein